MSGWAIAGQIAGELASAALSADSQHRANRTNIKLQREQQAWEQMMSNSAVQRHADDIEKAGGNRALAFVNGQQASTPSVAPARIEPMRYDSPNVASAVLMSKQLKLLEAQTKDTEANARIKNVEADIREGVKGAELTRRLNREVEEYEWDDIKTRILRSTDVSGAAEAKRLRESVDAIITQAKQAAEKGDLEVKQLRNIVNAGGLAPEDKDSILRYLIDVLIRKK